MKNPICKGCFFDKYTGDEACAMKIKIAAQGGNQCILKAPVKMVKEASNEHFEIKYPTADGTVVIKKEEGQESKKLIK